MNALFGFDELFDPEDFAKMLSRLGLDMVFTTVIVIYVYYRLYRDRELVFTYYIFNLITFAMCILLRKVPMDTGFALGLFAIFGILRYRTEQIRMRDLTYLFIVLGLAILNAVANKKVSLLELLTADIAIAMTVFALERYRDRLDVLPMLYDKVELLQPNRQRELHADLSARLGVEVRRVQVLRIDMLRDAAELNVYHRIETK